MSTRPRGYQLTDKALAALGVVPTAYVPLLTIPTYDDQPTERDEP